MAAVMIAIAFQLSVFLAIVIALIYVIVKRVEAKKRETFEDRDN